MPDLAAPARIVAAALVSLTLTAGGALAQTATLRIAVPVSLTGPGEFYGVPALNGARLAAEEANARTDLPAVELIEADDHSSPDTAKQLARQFAAGDALVAVGPVLTVVGMAAGPVYAETGLVSIVPTAHGDELTAPATTFQAIFNTSAMGGALADYLAHVLDGHDAVMLFRNDGLGRPIADGFRREANRLGIRATYRMFANPSERDDVARAVLQEQGKPAVVIGMLADDAVPLLKALRRGGLDAPILAPDALAGDNFADLFASEPEEQAAPGFFTGNLYAASPVMFDSADDETLSFVRRFRQRFGAAPSWTAVQGYDATRLAIAAARSAVVTVGARADLAARRKAIRDYLVSLDGPAHALPGVTGPLWFTPDRGREQPVRIGRFEGKLFESAPVQLVPVIRPDAAEIASGKLYDIGAGHYARRQQVVYTGIYLNEVPRLDIAPGTFTADFYFWLRFMPLQRATDVGNPADISFPDLVRGSFEPKQPVAERNLADGTVYRLWRVRGDFKNDFDLHHYPLDRQSLDIRLFNAKAASDRVVYVQDRRSMGAAGQAAVPAQSAAAGGIGSAQAATIPTQLLPDGPFGGEAAPGAFRNLTQWEPAGVAQRRDNLVTWSALGDPLLVGLERKRELSGFTLSIDVKRNLLATLAKTMLPLGIMALIMFASLHFPHGLVKEKVTVAITAALSGAVLLSSVNAQLGAVGYTMAIEYVFYVFFALCLFCILSVLIAERLRVAGRAAMAVQTELASRGLFIVSVSAIVALAAVVSQRW